MLTHDASEDPRASQGFAYPADAILEESLEEKERRIEHEAYREASKIFARVLNDSVFYILNHSSPAMAVWIVAYVLGLKAAQGKTCEDIGRICGLNSRQAVNKHIQDFCNATGYTSPVAKTDRAKANYSASRIASILDNQDPES